jgi:hypothetical protein
VIPAARTDPLPGPGLSAGNSSPWVPGKASIFGPCGHRPTHFQKLTHKISTGECIWKIFVSKWLKYKRKFFNRLKFKDNKFFNFHRFVVDKLDFQEYDLSFWHRLRPGTQEN